MQRTATAPGKMILSGEYAMVFGYPGLAIPSARTISASWTDEAAGPLTVVWEGKEESDPWMRYLRSIVTRVEEMAGPRSGTLTITGNLPLGKGMGSSTALVIAVARCLLGEDCHAKALGIEDAVNPGHSGMDFAAVWEGKSLRFQRGADPTPIAFDRAPLQDALLLDTGLPGEPTSELVAWVKSREKDLQDAFALIGDCTEALCGGEHPLTVFPDHHRAQLAIGVVPDAVHAMILRIEQSGGAAKVLGAGARTGGGGMVLAVHPDREALAGAVNGAYPLEPL